MTRFMPEVLDQNLEGENMGTCAANAAVNAMVFALGKEARMLYPFMPR